MLGAALGDRSPLSRGHRRHDGLRRDAPRCRERGGGRLGRIAVGYKRRWVRIFSMISDRSINARMRIGPAQWGRVESRPRGSAKQSFSGLAFVRPFNDDGRAEHVGSPFRVSLPAPTFRESSPAVYFGRKSVSSATSTVAPPRDDSAAASMTARLLMCSTTQVLGRRFSRTAARNSASE